MSGITAGVPAIDHHSHASAYRSGDKYRSVKDHEDHFITAHLESSLPAQVYRQFIEARNTGDTAQLETLDRNYSIQSLLNQGREFRSTTFFATSLRKGCGLLYGTDDESQFARLGDELRGRSLTAPYDEALKVANTPIALVDVRSIDSAVWNPQRYRQVIRIDPYFYPFGWEAGDIVALKQIDSWESLRVSGRRSLKFRVFTPLRIRCRSGSISASTRCGDGARLALSATRSPRRMCVVSVSSE